MIEQAAIAATGVTAIWLTQSKNKKARRFACLFGLAGQPFWFWSAIAAEQWGIFVLCCFYTVAWARGVKTNWWDAARADERGYTTAQRLADEAEFASGVAPSIKPESR